MPTLPHHGRAHLTNPPFYVYGHRTYPGTANEWHVYSTLDGYELHNISTGWILRARREDIAEVRSADGYRPGHLHFDVTLGMQTYFQDGVQRHLH